MLQGVQHVDDALLLSRMLCPCCLSAIVKASMPVDYGMEVEETGPVLRFLDLCLWSRGRDVHILPLTPNIAYSLGRGAYPEVARFPAYCDRASTPHGLLRSLLQPRLLVYDRIFAGSRRHGLRPTLTLVLEIARLGWPPRDIGVCLLDVNRVRQSEYLSSVRFLGGWIRGHTVEELLAVDLGAAWAQFGARQRRACAQ